jgi:TolB-like protein/Flp pilus assembly protein TadD
MIVVLPFENLGSPEDDYFAAGMTEEITSRLAVVSGMGVISRKSAVRYANTDKTMQEIGAELGVDYVLEGTVRWAKDGDSSRVRITPQLIQVSDDTHLWADTYDRVIEDVFALQSEIAESVITELGVNLLDAERRSLAVKPTDNPAAYQAYLQGLEILNHQSTGFPLVAVQRASKMFETAVELDPTFARAWAWLTWMKAFLHFGGMADEADLALGAKSALDRATDLAPEDSVVRLASGFYQYYVVRDYDRALQEFEAIAQELPNEVEVIDAIGWILRRLGRFEEAIAVQERALVLDPRNSRRFSDIATTYRAQRRFGEAFSSLDRAIELAPDSAALYARKAWYLIDSGRLDAARRVLGQAPVIDPMHEDWFWVEFFDRNFEAALEHAQLMSREEPWERMIADGVRSEALFQLDRGEESREVQQEAARAAETFVDSGSNFAGNFLGMYYARLGRKEAAIHAVEQSIELHASDSLEGPRAEEFLAYIHAIVGDSEAAIESFDRLLATSYSDAITVEMLRLDPRLDPIRDDPAFQAMLEKHKQRTD